MPGNEAEGADLLDAYLSAGTEDATVDRPTRAVDCGSPAFETT